MHFQFIIIQVQPSTDKIFDIYGLICYNIVLAQHKVGVIVVNTFQQN